METTPQRSSFNTGARSVMLAAFLLVQVHAEGPEWAKRAVWYQIFPERFCNGDSTNDPRPEDLNGAWPHAVATHWTVSKWTGDWYAMQMWEKEDGKPFYYEVQQRRYGGDIKGIIDKLDYLRQLGIGAIYLTPMFQSPSLHKYDASAYHHIDRNFGPNPRDDEQLISSENPADPASWQWTSADKLFLELIHQAHNRNIKIVLDGVFNHVGMTFWAFRDVVKNQQNSAYASWFTINRWDDPATPANEFDYVDWNGVKELPELREDEQGLVAGPRNHIKAVVKRWMDPNGDGNPEDGIDGWRLDVADKVSLNFWREFRSWATSINPNAYLVGEVWWEDWPAGKMYNAAPWLQGDAFDGVMNYRWAQEVFDFFAGRQRKVPATAFRTRLNALLSNYPPTQNYMLLNLLDSHDTDRLSSHIINSDLPYDKRVGLADNAEYAVRKPTVEELKTQKLMVLFQMTYLGAPMVYYGDEAGMWGGDDPDSRKPMVWPELKFDNERSHPFGRPRPNDTNEFNRDLHDWTAKLISIRNSHPSLQKGSFSVLDADDAMDTFAFVRIAADEQVIVILNSSDRGQTVLFKLPDRLAKKEWKDILSSGSPVTIANGMLRHSVEGKAGAILEAVRQ